MASPGTLPSARGRAGRPAAFQPFLVHPPSPAIRACRSVLLQREERPVQRIGRDMVEKRRQTLPWLPLYKLPYPVGRLCHASPTLCPARALAFQIPLGLGPWLHRLRGTGVPLFADFIATIPESDFSMPFIFGYRFLLSSAIPPRQRDGMETSQVPV